MTTVGELNFRSSCFFGVNGDLSSNLTLFADTGEMAGDTNSVVVTLTSVSMVILLLTLVSRSIDRGDVGDVGDLCLFAA